MHHLSSKKKGDGDPSEIRHALNMRAERPMANSKVNHLWPFAMAVGCCSCCLPAAVYHYHTKQQLQKLFTPPAGPAATPHQRLSSPHSHRHSLPCSSGRSQCHWTIHAPQLQSCAAHTPRPRALTLTGTAHHIHAGGCLELLLFFLLIFLLAHPRSE